MPDKPVVTVPVKDAFQHIDKLEFKIHPFFVRSADGQEFNFPGGSGTFTDDTVAYVVVGSNGTIAQKVTPGQNDLALAKYTTANGNVIQWFSVEPVPGVSKQPVAAAFDATPTADFNGSALVQFAQLSANIAFTASLNFTAGVKVEYNFEADGSSRNVALPSGSLNMLGATLTVAANKTAKLILECVGTAIDDTDVHAYFYPQP